MVLVEDDEVVSVWAGPGRLSGEGERRKGSALQAGRGEHLREGVRPRALCRRRTRQPPSSGDEGEGVSGRRRRVLELSEWGPGAQRAGWGRPVSRS